MGYYQFGGIYVQESSSGGSGTGISGTELKYDAIFWSSSTQADVFGNSGMVIPCKSGEVFYCNFKLQSGQNPKMLDQMPTGNGGASIGTLATATDDDGWIATSDGAMFFPIGYYRLSNWESYLADGRYNSYVVQNLPFSTSDEWYALNGGGIVAEPNEVLTNATMLEKISPLYGAKVAIIGDSLTEQSVGWDGTRDSFNFCHKKYNTHGWFSYIARKYMMDYIVHGFGQQRWYNTSSLTKGAVTGVDQLVACGYQPDIIIINIGGNDCWGGAGNFGSYEDVANKDATSTVGAVRYCIETLQAQFPDAKILHVMPCMRKDTVVPHELTYFALIHRVLADYGVQTCHPYRDAGINKEIMYTDYIHLHQDNYINGINYFTNDCPAVRKYSACIEASLRNL